MLIAKFTCGQCGRSTEMRTDSSRAVQAAYEMGWEHIMSSHRAVADELRAMSIPDRRARVMEQAVFVPTVEAP